MLDFKRIEQYVNEGKAFSQKELMSLLGMRSYQTFNKRVESGDIEKVIVGGEVCYLLKIKRLVAVAVDDELLQI